MDVFISWSGELSKKLGQAFRDWLPAVLQAVKPYFSPDDIEKGARWDSEIAGALERSETGILCMTPDNLEAPWILFEAGALAKQVGKARVCPVLFGLEPTDLKGPLAQFQAAVTFNKDEIRKVVAMMNGLCGESRLGDRTLDTVFEKWWPDLEQKVNAILSREKQKGPAPKPTRRDERDLLEEILSLVRASAPERGTYTFVKEFVDRLKSEQAVSSVVLILESAPRSIEELHRELGRLGFSAFYVNRALDQLVAMGRVRRVLTTHGTFVYELNE